MQSSLNSGRQRLEELLGRIWGSLVGGLTGPLKLRFVIQPLIATLLAARAGVRDARERRPPFLWALVTDRRQRTEHMSRGWKDVGKLFFAAIVADFVYQLIVNDRVYLLQSLLVATSLALLPYLLLCGVFNRIARRYARRRGARHGGPGAESAAR